MVREGECTARVWETSSRVRAIETKPESDRISAASRMVSEEREETKERRERSQRETRSEAAIDGENWSFRGRFCLCNSVASMCEKDEGGTKCKFEGKAIFRFWRERV